MSRFRHDYRLTLSFLVLILLFLLVLAEFQPVLSQSISNSSGVSIESYKPPVRIKPPNAEQWQLLTSDAIRWPDKATVKVGPNGLLELETSRQDTIKLNEGTRLETDFEDVDRTELDLDYGSVRVDFEDDGSSDGSTDRSMEIQTRHGVAGIRGTDFSVSYMAPRGMDVSVYEGSVRLETTGQRSIVIEAGRATNVTEETRRGKAPLKSRPIDEEQKLKWKNFKAQKKLWSLKKKKRAVELRRKALRSNGAIGRGKGAPSKSPQKLSERQRKLNNKIKTFRSRNTRVLNQYSRLRPGLLDRRRKYLERTSRGTNQSGGLSSPGKPSGGSNAGSSVGSGTSSPNTVSPSRGRVPVRSQKK
ncbi:MAG: FecR domain-containing protein [bacterium]